MSSEIKLFSNDLTDGTSLHNHTSVYRSEGAGGGEWAKQSERERGGGGTPHQSWARKTSNSRLEESPIGVGIVSQRHTIAINASRICLKHTNRVMIGFKEYKAVIQL